jgi:predicted dehydrogenase
MLNTADKPLKVLIIGLGGISFRYDEDLPATFVLTHARAFTIHSKFTLVGGVDLNKKNRDDFSLAYNCNVYGEIEDAVKNELPDVIVVATPTETHCQVIKTIFNHSKPPFILCEKPLAYNISEAQEILKACKDNNAWLYVNYMRNSSKVTSHISECINNGVILPPFKIVHWYTKGLYNSASHFIALFNHLLGMPLNVKLLDDLIDRTAIDPEPNFKITYRHAEAIFIALNKDNFFHNSFELIAKNGRLLYEQGGETVKWFRIESSGGFSNYKRISPNPVNFDSDFNLMQFTLVDNFWNEINSNNGVLCSGEDAYNTLLTINKILN